MGFKNADWQKLKMERRVTQIGNVHPQPGREHRPCRRRALPVTTLGPRLSRPGAASCEKPRFPSGSLAGWH